MRADDHSLALAHWRSLGVQGATCVHLDAHLDVHGYGELDCANFLRFALQEDTVGRLIWVVPDGLPEGPLLSWAYEELPRWLDVELAELRSLRGQDCLEGTLLGRPFALCRLDALPALEGPVLLDVDLDYLLDAQDRPWIEPEALASRLRMPTLALTFAYSLAGGYTPPEFAPLGDMLYALLTGDESPFPAHRETARDRGCRHFRHQRWAEAAAELRDCPDAPGRYLLALSLDQLERKEEAWSIFSELNDGFANEAYGRSLLASGQLQRVLELPSLSDSLRGQALLRAGRLREAAAALRAALRLTGERFSGLETRVHLCACYRALGQKALLRAEQEWLRQHDPTGQAHWRTLRA